jgi:hypothetical protein
MRIFPDYLNGVLTPLGQAFIVLAALIAFLGLGFFLRQEYVLHSWGKADGVVTTTRIEEERNNNGDLLCSAVATFTFSVNEKRFSSQSGGRSYDGDCPTIREEARKAVNSHVQVLYDPDDPRSSYLNAGFNIEFFLVSFVLALTALGFAIAGFVTYKIGKRMNRNNVALL